MRKRRIVGLATVFGAIIGYECNDSIGSLWFQSLEQQWSLGMIEGRLYWMMGIGALVAFFIANGLYTYVAEWLRRSEERLATYPSSSLMAGGVGLFAGILLAVLLTPVVTPLSPDRATLPLLLTVVFSYFGWRFGYARKQEFAQLADRFKLGKDNHESKSRKEDHKILDTSVIIDGRIADICKTGFIEGTLVIAEFVLEELQHIADSSDLLKRNRGRRGLDILNRIQKDLDVKVLIYEGDFDEISEVDSKLVKLAKVLGGKVITNDFNLNKVCELQGVAVLNINDLANAIKPVVLPGEEICVQVIKDGKEFGQGVAYLDDGTMIVVEGGRDFIGLMMEVMVTSVLQTSAGRMIFAKPKLLEKAL